MDEQLKQVFAELRRADRQAIPPFERVWAAATARRLRRRPWMRWGIAATGTAALVVVALILLHRRTIAGLDAAARLASWRSPTASLLRFPGDDLLRAVPTLGASHVALETLPPAATTP